MIDAGDSTRQWYPDCPFALFCLRRQSLPVALLNSLIVLPVSNFPCFACCSIASCPLALTTSPASASQSYCLSATSTTCPVTVNYESQEGKLYDIIGMAIIQRCVCACAMLVKRMFTFYSLKRQTIPTSLAKGYFNSLSFQRFPEVWGCIDQV